MKVNTNAKEREHNNFNEVMYEGHLHPWAPLITNFKRRKLQKYNFDQFGNYRANCGLPLLFGLTTYEG